MPTRFMLARPIVRSARSWASGRRCSSTVPSICASAGCCCRHFMASGWRRTPLRCARRPTMRSRRGRSGSSSRFIRRCARSLSRRSSAPFSDSRMTNLAAELRGLMLKIIRALLEPPRHAAVSARDAHRRRRVESMGARGQADAPDRFDPVRGIRAAEKGRRRGTRRRPLDAAGCALRKRTTAPRQRNPRRDVHADARGPRNHRSDDGVGDQPAASRIPT